MKRNKYGRLKIVYVDINELKPSEYNPRKASKDQVEQLKESIGRYGLVDPLIVNSASNRRNIIIGGHFRWRVAKDIGIKRVPVVYLNIPDLRLEQELNLRLNKNLGEWDWDLLANLDDKLLSEVGFNADEMARVYMEAFRSRGKNMALREALKNDFIVPPFSVFDTRAGYWQDRKREWLGYFGDRLVMTKEGLIGSSGKKNPLMYSINKGTSVFDPVLAEIMYKWLVPAGGTILNPFCGEPVTGIVAAFLGYRYIGIDIRPEQIKINRDLANEFKDDFKYQPEYIVGDAADVNKLLGNRRVDFIFTSPPYFNLEVYSLDPNDLSTKPDYDKFISQYEKIITDSVKHLNDNRFAVVKISETRWPPGGGFVNFVGDNIRIFKDKLGFYYYNEIILVNAVGTASLRARNTFKKRKVVRVHQNVPVFYRGQLEKMHCNVSVFYRGDIDLIREVFNEPIETRPIRIRSQG